MLINQYFLYFRTFVGVRVTNSLELGDFNLIYAFGFGFIVKILCFCVKIELKSSFLLMT